MYTFHSLDGAIKAPCLRKLLPVGFDCSCGKPLIYIAAVRNP